MRRLLTLAFLLIGSLCYADDPPRLKLTYKGGCRMPTVANSAIGTGFGSSLGPVARKPDGSFLVYGLFTTQEACVVRPNHWGASSTRNSAALPQSALVQGWHDPTNGKRAELNAAYAVTAGQGFRAGGVCYDSANNGYFNLYRWYNVQGESLPSLFRVAADGTVSNAYFCGDYHSAKTDYMITQDASGNLWCGESRPNGVGIAGPSAYKLAAFDTSLPYKAKQPASEFLLFPLAEPLKWRTPAPLVGGDQFYRNRPLEQYRPEEQWWFGTSWNCRTMFVRGGSICYVVQRPLGTAWYGDPIVSDGVTALECSRTNSRGYNTVAYQTSIYEFPYLISSNGTDKRYREVAGLQHKLLELDSSLSGNYNPTTGDLYLLESTADRATGGPVLHWVNVSEVQ